MSLIIIANIISRNSKKQNYPSLHISMNDTTTFPGKSEVQGRAHLNLHQCDSDPIAGHKNDRLHTFI